MDVHPNLVGGSIWVDLRGIREGTHPLILDGCGEVLSIGEGAERVLRRFRLEGVVSFDGGDYQVRGSLRGTLETACDRCLVRFGRPLRARVEVRAIPEDLERAAEEPREGVVWLGPERRLDLLGPLREAVLVEVPLKNLCRADCRGLCPVCGVNRNEESCECRPSAPDPRWEALRDLTFPSEPKE